MREKRGILSPEREDIYRRAGARLHGGTAEAAPAPSAEAEKAPLSPEREEVYRRAGARAREIGFRSWLESVNDFSERMSGDYAKRSGVYQSAEDFGKYRDQVSGDIDSMLGQERGYRDYFSRNRELFGDEAVDSALKALAEGGGVLENARSGLGSEYDYRAQFKDEDDYKNYKAVSGGSESIDRRMDELRVLRDEAEQRRNEARAVMSGTSRYGTEGQRAEWGTKLKEAEAEYDLYNQRYNDLLNQYYRIENEEKRTALHGDKDALGQYGSAQSIQEDMDKVSALMADAQTHTGGPEIAEYKEYLAEKYGLDQKAIDQYAVSGAGGAYAPRTDGGYNNLYELYQELQGRKEKAVSALGERGYDYARMTEYEQRRRDAAAYQEKMQEWQQYAKDHPVLSSAETVLMAPFQGVDYLKTMAGGIGHSDVDDPARYVPMDVYNMDAANFVSEVRDTVSKDIADKTDWELFGKNVASFLYESGMSIADSTANLAAFGPTGALFVGSGTAAANQARDVIQRGGTNDQAFWGGLAAGAAEALFEKVSIDRLLAAKSVTGWKSFLRETAKQMGTEASEEMLTEISNILTDAAIMGENSSFERSVEEYKAQGMSGDEARKQAFLDCVGQVVEAGAGGALSGGVMGGTLNAANLAGNTMQNSRTGQAFSGMGLAAEDIQAFIDEGLASGPDTQAHKLAAAAQQKLQSGGTLTNYELGRLYQANVQAVDAEDGSDGLLLRAAEEVTRKGRVTNNTASDILNSPAVIDTLTQEAGLNITEDMSKSGQRKAVKNAVEALARARGGVSVNAGEMTQGKELAPQTAVQGAQSIDRAQAAGTAAREAPGTALTAEQQARNLQSMDRAARAFGENGGKALAASYDGNVRTDEYYAGFTAYYEAGVNGTGMDRARGRYSDRLNQAQRFAAYSAGQNDAALSLKREQQAAKYAPMAGEGSGLVYDDFVKQAVESGRTLQDEQGRSILDVNGESRPYLTAEAAARVNSAAKALGVRVRFVDSISVNGQTDAANAQIAGAEVQLQKDNENPVMFLIGHELTHRIQELAPEAYRAFRAAAADDRAVQEAVAEQIRRHTSRGLELPYERALDEAAADYAGRMIDDGRVLDDFIERHRDDRTLLQKVRDAIRSLIDKLTGTEKKKAQTAEGKLAAALEAAQKQAETLTRKGNAAQEDGVARFSIKYDQSNTPYVVIENDILAGVPETEWVKAVKDNLRRKFPEGVTVGNNVVSINQQSRQEMTFSKYMQRLFSVEPQMYADKLRATDNADEILRAARSWVNEALLHPRKDTIIDFARGEVLLRIGTNDYSAQVIVGNRGKSGLLLYDIINLSATSIQERTKKVDAEYTANAQDKPHSRGPASTENSVPQDGGEIKAKFSMKAPVEETRNLIALHNLTEEKLLRILLLGGFPMPSIAVTRIDVPHTNFGDITLVMDKRSIDPKANRKNTVYSADAWTPTFPRVEYSADPKVERRISERLRELSGRVDKIFEHDLYNASYDMEDLLNRHGGEEGLLRHVMDNYGLKAAYLEDTGHHISASTVQREADKGYRQDRAEKYQAIADALGTDDPDEIVHIPLKELRDRYGDELEAAFPGVTKSAFRLSGIIRQVQAYLQDRGGEPVYETVTDAAATYRAIDDALDRTEYERWALDLYSGIEAASGVYNNKEFYTTAGNRRTFQQTHYPVTLEGIVKAMAGQNGGNTKNASGFYGVKSLRAGTAQRFKSIADMHKLEGRLQNLTKEQTNAIHDELNRRLMDITEALAEKSPNGKGGFDYSLADSIGNILMEVADGGNYTIDSIMRKFNGEYGYQIGNELAAEVRDLLFDVSQMPTNMFEAKPERVVGFDEVLAAVIPDNSSQKLRDGLEQAGVRTLEYKAGDDGDRLEKVNSVEGAKFSLKEDTVSKSYAALLEENSLLRERIDYWKGQTRRTQRVTTDKKAVEKAARELIRTTGADMDAADIRDDLQSLYDYIASGYDGKDELTYDEARRRAEAIASRLTAKAVAVDDDMYQQYGDLRSYLRTRKIRVPREMWAEFDNMGGYNELRKAYWGKLDLSSTKGAGIDQVYQELSSMYPEFFDEQQISNPADQLSHIMEVLDGIYDISEYNPFSYDARQAAAGIANEIMEQFFDLPQTRKTFADRQAAKLDKAKAKGRQQVQKVREQANERLAKQRKQNRERTEAAISRERQRRNERVQQLKAHYAEVRQNQAARRADSKARTRLLRIAKRLQNKKLPAANRALLDQYIGDLDTVSKSMTGKTLEKLSDLQAWYNDRKENDPDFISDPGIERALARLSKRHIGDMTAEEVADLTCTLLNIENELRTEHKLIDEKDRRDTYLLGQESIQNIYNTKGSSGALDKFIVTETLSPVRQVRRMTGYVDNDPLYQLTLGLADGQRAMLDYQMKAERPFERFAGDRAFSKSFSGPKAESIQVTGFVKGGGKTVAITPAMRVSLYLHSLNDQNLRHIKEGGITVPDEKLYRSGKLEEAYARGTTIKLTPSQVRGITSGMTEKEKAFAAAAHKYFNEASKSAINETSEKLKGYSLAAVENYFPINTDNSFTRSEFETLKRDGTIEGMGFLKERVRASNPILLRDANAVLEQAIRMHGKYVGLAIPVRNFNKVWNVTIGSYNEDGSRSNFDGSVQQAVKQRWGETGYGYIEKLMTDLQGGANQKNVWVKALNKIRSNYAGAVLTLNLSVAMKQAASYPTAAAVLGWGPLVRAMTDVGKADLGLIEKYTPLQWYRSKGFSTKELGDLKTADRQLPPILNWVQGVDLLTTRKLWKASEYYVRQNNKGLPVGTDAYYRAVADIYNRVIEETQPNYTTMQRPQLLRSDDTLMGNLAMFKTQPFQNFNILYDAAGNYAAKAEQAKYGGKKADAQKAKADLGRAITSQLAQLAVFAGMTMVWALLRGRKDKYANDDGDLDAASILTALGKDMAGGALSGVPFGSDAWELLSSKLFGDAYYGMDAVTVTAISDTIQALSDLAEQTGRIAKNAASGAETNWNSERLKLDRELDKISKAAGVPYENVVNLFNMVFRQTAIASQGQYLGGYAYLKLTTDPEEHASDYYNLLYRAMQNSRTDYETIYNDMVKQDYFSTETRTTQEAISAAMEKRMMDAQGVTKVSELERRYLSPNEEKDWNRIYGQAKSSGVWAAASQDQRDKLEGDLYNLVTGGKAGEKLQKKIDAGAAYGIDDTDYLLYRLALSVADKPTESGKLKSYTNAEVEEAINMLTGLSDQAKSFLWASQGGSEKNDPWG